jgi:hypothetical protein
VNPTPAPDNPVTADDIVSGATKFLLAQPETVAAVSSYIIGGAQVPGIFQYRTWTDIEGTSTSCVVLSTDGGWAGANLHNTLRFPRLTLNVWVDPIRDSARNVTDPGEAMRRSFSVFKAFDRFLHRTGGDEVYFGTLRIISSTRLTEPTISAVSDGDGLVRLQASYAVTEG